MRWNKKLRKSPPGANKERGFSLIELMVAVAAFAIVSVAAFAVLDSGQRNALMNDQTVKVQQNVRLAMDLIARDIRMTGYGNPNLGVTPFVGCGSHMNATNAATGPNTSDTIAIMTVNQEVGQLSGPLPAPPPAAPTDMPMQNLLPGWGPGVVTLDGIFTSGAALANPALLTLTTTLPPTASFPTGTRVFDLACVIYSVTGAGATPPFQLMRAVGGAAAVAIVDGIESIQFAYAIDADGNGAIDDQAGGVLGTFDCLDFVPNNGACTDVAVRPANTGTVAAIPVAVSLTPTPVRQVRVTVIGRAIPPANMNVGNNCWYDRTFTGRSRVTVEDQVLPEPVLAVGCPALLPPDLPSGIRRRVLTRVVSLRETSLN
jgi:prepilin-type N-terminal cleavage/methylation domain-containing protein